MRRIHTAYFLILVIAFLMTIGIPALPARSGFAQPAARVTRVELSADPQNPSGPCPATIKFVGSVTTSSAGQVTYTFPRSDGAIGPELTLNFEQAGIKEVSTTWTLGDSIGLPYYEGWQSIKILSPNALESEHAKFVLNCKSTDSNSESEPRPIPALPRPQPKQPPAENLAIINTADYLPIWRSATADATTRLGAELSKLKNFATRSRPGLSEAAIASGYDPQTALADYRQIGEETDPSKRIDQQAAFDAKYRPAIFTVARNANIDLQKERSTLLTELNLDDVATQPRSMLVIDTDPPTGGPPAQPTSDDTILRSPWRITGAVGDHATANPMGNLTVFATAAGAGLTHQMAFVGAPFWIDPGVTRIHAVVTFRPAAFEVRAFSLFLFGYSSAEAIVNVRIMEGSQVVATEHLSLAREITAVFGWGERNESPLITLNCDYTRPNPQATSAYTVVAEAEAYVGAGGFSGARVWMHPYVQEIRITKEH